MNNKLFYIALSVLLCLCVKLSAQVYQVNPSACTTSPRGGSWGQPVSLGQNTSPMVGAVNSGISFRTTSCKTECVYSRTGVSVYEPFTDVATESSTGGRIARRSSDGWDDIDDPGKPSDKYPVGTPAVLLLFAAAYLCYVAIRKRRFSHTRVCIVLALIICGQLSAATWSFSGGYMYFDNSQTQWEDNVFMLIIGKSSYSSVYEMMSDDEGRYYCALPTSGWGDAEYMAVISADKIWGKGNWGPSNLVNAKHYTATYTAGLTSNSGKGYLFTPQSATSGCTINLSYMGDVHPEVTFADVEKNNCQKLDTDNGTVTLIFSTSSKRFNISASDVKKVYAYGSITGWNNQDEAYRLNRYSEDGCFYRTFTLEQLARRGNSGQPEFLFHVYKADGSDYVVRSHASWQGGIDERLVFVNNGENMMVLMPGDDLDELAARKAAAQYIKPLSEFNLTDSAEVAHLTNFRRVPGTKHLYRSYHPYKPDRAQYDTEHERMVRLAQLGAQYGIQSDIALSGNETGKAGNSYTCGGQTYTITIPAYYQTIIANDNVLYVGTANGHTPDYNHAVFETNGERFAEWMQEVVRFINSHPAPFQIHCSLGADRTGAFSATLAALCGATWEQIAADYHETSNLKIQEYRHPNCVRYELYLLTGQQPEDCANLSQAVADHFINGGYLTQAEIDTCVKKLRGEDTPTDVCVDSDHDIIRPSKRWQDGHLVILRGNRVYDVCGSVEK